MEKEEFRSMLTSEGIDHFRSRKNDSFQKAKDRWIKTAKVNTSQTSGLVEEVLSKTEGMIWGLVDAKPVDLL